MNTKNAYNKLSSEQQAAREIDVNRYLEGRKLFPEVSNQLAEFILDTDDYKERKKLIKEGKQELRSDKKEMTQLEAEIEQDKIILSQKEEKISQLKEKLGISPELSEQLPEGASENMKNMMQSQYDKMHLSNKPYKGDLEKLQGWKGLKYREEAGVKGVKIIDVPGFGELCSTVQSGTEYRDMDDKGGKRSIDNLKDSDKFKAFASTIQGCEMMQLSDTYKLMNLVAQQLGITDTIDENYINTVFKEYKNKNLPGENPIGRILRALYMMTGDWFVIPISVDGKMVRSVDCDDNNAWIYDYGIDSNYVRPFAKIGGSH